MIDEVLEFNYKSPKRKPIGPIGHTGSQGPIGPPGPYLFRKDVYKPRRADNLVSVQPLLQPTGLIYYLRWRYSQNKGNNGNNRTNVSES